MEALAGHAARWSKRMEKELKANSHKGISWFDDDPAALVERVYDELDELKRAIDAGLSPDEVEAEAADVGNMSGMAADAYRRRATPTTDKGNP